MTRTEVLEEITARQGRTLRRIAEVCKASEEWAVDGGGASILAKTVLQIISDERKDCKSDD